VAADELARGRVWDEIARLGYRRVVFSPLHEPVADQACEALEGAGYRVLRRVARLRPYLPLPDTWDDLLASVSHNLRGQWRRKRRALDADGGLVDGFDERRAQHSPGLVLVGEEMRRSVAEAPRGAPRER
jgi:hypothetical protein